MPDVARASHPGRCFCVATLLGSMAVSLLVSASAHADPPADRPFVQVTPRAELGFLLPLSHTIQYGKQGSTFDYVDEGGQGLMVPFYRLSTELLLAQRHAVVFLYQPLQLDTQVRLDRAILVDELTFLEGTPLDLVYGFNFWRLSYLYDLLGSPAHELSVGASLQIRNARVVFSSADGTSRRSFTDLGPVPLLKVRGRTTFDAGLWLGGEIDFIYAPVKYINGGDSDVEGALVDLNLRAGYRLRPDASVYLNVRYLAGGAEGTSSDSDAVGDGFTANWLHFLTVSLGAELSLL